MKFELKSTDYSGAETTIKFEVDCLPDVLLYVEQFLRGSGYYVDGSLELVREESSEDIESDESYFSNIDLEEYAEFPDSEDSYNLEVGDGLPLPKFNVHNELDTITVKDLLRD